MTRSIAFFNGNVRPCGDERTASALLVESGKVRCVGNDGDVKSLAPSDAEYVDLGGRTLLPGFYDTHLHLMETGKSLGVTPLFDVSSIAALIQRGRADLENQRDNAGGWVYGRGWNQEKLAEKRFPTRHDLDEISTDRPILYTRACGIAAVLNTKGLEAVGIGRAFSIVGGQADRDVSGEPNGIVRREALDGWVKRKLPPVTEAMAKNWLLEIAGRLPQVGLTSVQSDDLDLYYAPDSLTRIYRECAASGALPVRTAQQYLFRSLEDFERFTRIHGATGKGDDDFNVGPLKIIVDGSLGSRTAVLRGAYADAPEAKGIFVRTDEALKEMLSYAHANDWQIAAHNIGDGALEKYLDLIEELQRERKNAWKHRVIHCQIGDTDLYERMARLGVGADVQPPFVASDWYWVADRVGVEKSKRCYAWKTLLSLGIVVAGGCDAPVEPFAPLWGIRTAVTRTDRDGNPPGGWLPAERLSVKEALALYTSNAARICGDFDRRGTLEEGKWGDAVVLEADPFVVSPVEIADIPVWMTVKGGAVTYSA